MSFLSTTTLTTLSTTTTTTLSAIETEIPPPPHAIIPIPRPILRTRIAFITGITGQDGSYLAELLLSKNYIVHGLIRRSSTINTHRIEHIFNDKNLKLHYGDITDSSCLQKILNLIKNTYSNMERLEIYNLAAQSHVKVSFEMPEYTDRKSELEQRVLDLNSPNIVLLKLSSTAYNDSQIVINAIEYWLENPLVNVISFRAIGAPNR